MGFGDKEQTEEKNPMFNSGLDYLSRIDSLMVRTHEAWGYRDHQLVFTYLRQLFTELMKWMTKKQREDAERLEKKAGNAIFAKDRDKSLDTRAIEQRIIRFERHLHVCYHESNLGMGTKATGSEASSVI